MVIGQSIPSKLSVLNILSGCSIRFFSITANTRSDKIFNVIRAASRNWNHVVNSESRLDAAIKAFSRLFGEKQTPVYMFSNGSMPLLCFGNLFLVCLSPSIVLISYFIFAAFALALVVHASIVLRVTVAAPLSIGANGVPSVPIIFFSYGGKTWRASGLKVKNSSRPCAFICTKKTGWFSFLANRACSCHSNATKLWLVRSKQV